METLSHRLSPGWRGLLPGLLPGLLLVSAVLGTAFPVQVQPQPSDAHKQHAHKPHAHKQHAQTHAHHRGAPAAPLGVQSIDVYRDRSTLHLLTGERHAGDDAPALWYRKSQDEGRNWSTPVRVDYPEAKPDGLRPGNDAQIVAAGEDVVAMWSIAGTGWAGSGPLAGARSRDGGKTWERGSNPADDGSTEGHGFVALFARGDGLHAVWLDARDKAQGLRHARSTDGGASWSPNRTIAEKTCECCWNAVTPLQDGEMAVLYRGKAPRDMQLAVSSHETWTQRGPVAAFGWDVNACPETGGGLAASDDGRVHALVWTGLPGREGVYYAASPDAGNRWGAPRRMGSSDAQHAALAAQGNTLAAVWDETRGTDRVVLASLSDQSGRRWRAPLLLSRRGADAAYPHALATGGGFLVLWIETGRGGERVLRQRRLDLPKP
jgi:hypothetical protein